MRYGRAVRARELGIRIGRGAPGRHNAITDVPGVRVGHATLIDGEAVRTGVTVVLPHEGNPGRDPVFAGSHRLNGNGELTGLEWVRESGLLTSPVAITNTFSVGVVRDALVGEGLTAGLPVVGETYDGLLNDIDGMHVRPSHVVAALGDASDGPVAEGNVGGGTGMVCHGFKGGIGTASRVLDPDAGGYTIGVLVQANYGSRRRFRVDGAPVGEVVDGERVPLPPPPPWLDLTASIIVVVATDAPLLPGQCDRVAQRAALAIGRMGGLGEHSSGDLVLAFSTGNRGLRTAKREPAGPRTIPVEMLSHAYVNALFEAAVDATEEAILNALLAAETMTGRGGVTVYALEADVLVAALEELGRPPSRRL